MSIWVRSLLFKFANGIGAIALGCAILWQIAEHCGPAKGIAYVHVGNPQVKVTVDDQSYWVETLWDSPIVCEVRPGRHILRMEQQGRVVFQQEFRLSPGQEVVLAGSAGCREMRSADPPEIPSAVIRQSLLLAR
jgi:hypothetical protein